MDKKQIRKSYKMDLKHFLMSYYGIENAELLDKLGRLSHKDFKMIARDYGLNVVRTNFDLITKEQIADGTVILVNDTFNNPAPYVNPNRVLACGLEFDTELDSFYVSSVTEEIKYDKKGRQKSLKRIIKIRKGDRDD